MKLSLSNKLFGGFAVAAAGLIVTGWAATQSTKRLQENGRWVAHTQEVIATSEAVRSTFRGMESERRIYALVGATEYAVRHDALSARLLPLARRLRELTKDNPAQQVREDTLVRVLADARAFSDSVVDARRRLGLPAAAALAGTGRGQVLGRAVDGAIDRLIAAERALAVTRDDRVRASAQRSLLIIAGSTILSLVLLALALAALLRELRARARQRERLKESQANLQDFLDSANDLVHSVGPDARFLYVNDAWHRALGYDQADLATLTLFDIFDGESRARAHETFPRILRGERVRDAEFNLRTKAGEPLTVSASSTCRIVDGQPVATRTIMRDITERKEVERLKDQFVSVVSHELRTPLTSIRGALGLLASGKLADPAQASRMVTVAVTNTDRLIRLINDILDVERVSTAAVPMERSRQEARVLVHDAVEAVRATLDRARIACVTHVDDVAVFADGDRIIQTLTNLLGNAAKFSPQDSTIAVRVEARAHEAQFSMQDQGRGIPSDKLSSIFDRFQQVDASDARELGGTGLGLAICRSIVQQHGGRIWAESVEGKGSTFHFMIPLATASDVQPLAPVRQHSVESKASNGRRQTVLVIEDDTSLAQVLSATIEGHGFRVERAYTAGDALARLRDIDPDVVVADLLLPDATGLDLVHRLHAVRDVCQCPVVVYTADDLSAADREVLRTKSVELVMKARTSPEQLASRVREILNR